VLARQEPHVRADALVRPKKCFVSFGGPSVPKRLGIRQRRCGYSRLVCPALRKCRAAIFSPSCPGSVRLGFCQMLVVVERLNWWRQPRSGHRMSSQLALNSSKGRKQWGRDQKGRQALEGRKSEYHPVGPNRLTRVPEDFPTIRRQLFLLLLGEFPYPPSACGVLPGPRHKLSN
jgi:hypothetical protein